jgi:anthranilate synthase/aminodeoxychorismate synthase-like glutamine amidotransferase
MIRLLLIDNFDSFTWNVVGALRKLGAEVEVRRNNELPNARAVADAYHGVVVSPGPGLPLESGQCPEVVQLLMGQVPILGICLGHQLLAELTGGRLVACPEPVHGKRSRIRHNGGGLFQGLPTIVEVMRYHSWAVDETSLAAGWRVSARTDDSLRTVMAIDWAERMLWGVQFHPESVMTPWGERMLANWLSQVMLRNTVLMPRSENWSWNIC